MSILNKNIGIFDIGFSDLGHHTPVKIREKGVWIGPRNHKVVGECLEAARKEAGVTQQELARRLGKPQSFVSSYETGQRRIDVLEFYVITTALGVDARLLFSKIGESAADLVQKTLRSV